MPSELPISASILASETGLSETKAASLIEATRLAGMTVCHSRTHLVFRSDVAEFLRERTRSRNNECASPEAKSLEDAEDRKRRAEELLKQINSRSRQARRRG